MHEHSFFASQLQIWYDCNTYQTMVGDQVKDLIKAGKTWYAS
jgi:hypothetical protein